MAEQQQLHNLLPEIPTPPPRPRLRPKGQLSPAELT